MVHAPVEIRGGETSLLEVRGLPVGSVVELCGRRLPCRPDGAVSQPFAPLGLLGEVELRVLSATGRRIANAMVVVEPTKLRAEQFRQLCLELEQAWTGLILGEHGSLGGAGADDIVALWRRLTPSLTSLLAAPYAPLAATSSNAPLARARHIDMRPSAALARGLATRSVVPTRRALPDPDNVANRMVAHLCERVAVHADRQGRLAVADHARRLRRHATLAGLTAAAFDRPPRAVLADPRYRICWWALGRLPQTARFQVHGPGAMPLQLGRMMDLWEYWVFLRVVRTLEDLFGPPLPPGFAVLGSRAAAHTLRVELSPGTTIAFPGGVRATFDGRIPRQDLRRQEAVVFAPSAEFDSKSVRPDVVVTGPRGIVVIDAKYRGTSVLDHEARELHRKYARLTVPDNDQVRVLQVVAAHPHAGYDGVRYAGYSALPLLPGTKDRWLGALLAQVGGLPPG